MPEDKNIGDKRAGYPDASQIPEAQEGAPQEGAVPAGQEGGNPVVDAITTLQQFIVAQEEKGNPNAQAMKQALIQFLTSLSGKAGTPAPEEESEAVEIVSEEEPTKEKKQPIVM